LLDGLDREIYLFLAHTTLKSTASIKKYITPRDKPFFFKQLLEKLVNRGIIKTA